MKKINKIPIIITLALIVFDQITKLIAVDKLKPIGSMEVIKDFFYLTFVENRGAAFGMLQGARWIFILIAIGATIFGVFYYNKLPKNKFEIIGKIGIVFIISGAIGNLIDRLFRGYVVDMLHFIFWGNDFAVFNFADVFVCVGTFLLVLVILFSETKEKKGA